MPDFPEGLVLPKEEVKEMQNMTDNAKWIYCTDEEKKIFSDPWQNVDYNSKLLDFRCGKGIPSFRKKFNIHGSLIKAVLKITALGIFDVFINGERVGRTDENDGTVFDEMKPGRTDYNKRVLVYNYDVSAYLREGENTIFVRVSNGWWSGRISFGFHGYQNNALLASMQIEYADSRIDNINTDTDWECAITGPVMTVDIWDGEYYDARIDTVNDYKQAALYNDFKGVITDAEEPYIRVKQNLIMKPRSAVIYDGIIPDGSDYGKIKIVKKIGGESVCENVKLGPDDTLQLDFGQNIVGRPHIRISAKEGTKITIYFAEMLNDSGEKARGNDGAGGSVYLANYRSARARIVYIASGYGIEDYFPTHTYFGFRYLEITAECNAEIISVTGEPMGSDIKETGSIITSNDEINKLCSNIIWGQRGNYFSIPTDCPQRDERLGWTGDTQIFCGAAAYNADVRGFFKKWLRDVRDSQYNGGYCDVIPRFRGVYETESNAAWGDAGIIVPYKIYKMYGDVKILADHYESMNKYMEHLTKFGLDGANTAYGDWLAYEDTDNRYISIAYYAYDAQIMAEVSCILLNKENEQKYNELYERIKEHFASCYITDGVLTQTSQTAYLLALKFNLIPDTMRNEAVRQLAEKIKDNGCTLSTGFVGTGILLQTLCELGLDNLCYSLLLQTKDPSWLYSVRQGATTVWERWNSYTKENGLGDIGMNSFNHYAYGAVMEWMYAYMAGIAPDGAGFKKFILRPRPDFRKDDEIPAGQNRITYVKASYETDFGKIVSEWKLESGLHCYCQVPEGTTATYILPLLNKDIYVNGIKTDAEIKYDKEVLTLAAGKYSIEQR